MAASVSSEGNTPAHPYGERNAARTFSTRSIALSVPVLRYRLLVASFDAKGRSPNHKDLVQAKALEVFHRKCIQRHRPFRFRIPDFRFQASIANLESENP
jgi:hypothetical protein